MQLVNLEQNKRKMKRSGIYKYIKNKLLKDS